jgi:hypothetical protein
MKTKMKTLLLFFKRTTNSKKVILLLLGIVCFHFFSNGMDPDSPWVQRFNPPVAQSNLRPYYYGTATATDALALMQQNISDAVIILRTNNNIGTSNSGTATFIRTDPTLNYVCVLTAGHLIMPANGVAPAHVILNHVGLHYRRTGIENWGDGFNSPSISFIGIDNVDCTVLGASVSVNANGTIINDYALRFLHHTMGSCLSYTMQGVWRSG